MVEKPNIVYAGENRMKCHNCKYTAEEITDDVHWCTGCGSISCPRFGDLSSALSRRTQAMLVSNFYDARRRIQDLGKLAGIEDPDKIVY